MKAGVILYKKKYPRSSPCNLFLISTPQASNLEILVLFLPVETACGVNQAVGAVSLSRSARFPKPSSGSLLLFLFHKTTFAISLMLVCFSTASLMPVK
jgi:hypothetical protein